MNRVMPSFMEENRLHRLGYGLIAGIDEVGRGAMAGPVVAAAVIMPEKVKGNWVKQVRDSKQLTPAERELLYPMIQEAARSVGVGFISHEIIDYINILAATRLAMKVAIEQLRPAPEYLLIDYLVVPEIFKPQKGVPGGDSVCFSIACASIIAKVARDHLMDELDGAYPGYGLAQHKGYCTVEHRACLERLGPSPIHRRSWQPIQDLEDEP